MNKPRSVPNCNRRAFLGFVAASGLTAAAGYALYNYAPWLEDGQQASSSRKPLEQDSTAGIPRRELIRYATLAASGHNTQPWKFAVNAATIEIHPDYTRRLPAVDPNDRELWISLGCALENLVVAARANGYETQVSYPDTADFIQVRLTKGTAHGSYLLEVIARRQNTRSKFDGRRIKTTDFDQLQALRLEPGVVLHFVTQPAGMETVLEYVNQGNRSQFSDQAFVEELIRWIRFNKREALASLDGLHSRCMGSPEVPRWLGKFFVAGTKPREQAEADAAKLRSSPVAVVVATQSDDKTAWVRTGQVYERLAIAATALNIKSAFLNQPIEVAGIRGQFQTATGIGPALPQLLVRLGYADPLPQSLRRSVEQVLLRSPNENSGQV